jgi:hypothetical protein
LPEPLQTARRLDFTLSLVRSMRRRTSLFEQTFRGVVRLQARRINYDIRGL